MQIRCLSVVLNIFIMHLYAVVLKRLELVRTIVLGYYNFRLACQTISGDLMQTEQKRIYC